MFRRFVYTLLGAMAGYLVGAVVGMTAFAAIYGYRSISILEESNRNRWTFVAASAAAVAGGLIAWWRSYTDDPAAESVGQDDEPRDMNDDSPADAPRPASEGEDAEDTVPAADAPRSDQSGASP